MIQFAGQPWAPSRYVPPLRDDLVLSDGPRLCQLIERHYRVGRRLIELDDWQHAALNHLLERYPLDWPVEPLRGQLRFRQALISLGRQNGKSILGGIAALYGLLQHVETPNVVGVAKSVDQANVIYSRVEYAVRADAKLSALLRASGTRGIRRRDRAGMYLLKPALEEGLQSVPITLCVADELHLTRPAMWDSVVQGQRAQPVSLLVGITTAGDAKSELLIRLYGQADTAIAAAEIGDPGRFGAWIWEAPEGATLDTPGALEAANPAIACGRVDLDTARADVRSLPEADIERYALNRFVGAAQPWLSIRSWRAAAGAGLPDTPDDLVVGVRYADEWRTAALSGAQRHPDGRLTVELLASLVRTDVHEITAAIDALAEHQPVTVVVASDQSDVGKACRAAGHETHILTPTEVAQAADRTAAAVRTATLGHAADDLLTLQVSSARRTSSGRLDAGDAVLAAVYAVQIADTKPPRTSQLF